MLFSCRTENSGRRAAVTRRISFTAQSHMDLRATVARRAEDICLERRGGFFPLTLTLSLVEREQRALRSGKPMGVDCSPSSAGFTLSPGRGPGCTAVELRKGRAR